MRDFRVISGVLGLVLFGCFGVFCVFLVPVTLLRLFGVILGILVLFVLLGWTLVVWCFLGRFRGFCVLSGFRLLSGFGCFGLFVFLFDLLVYCLVCYLYMFSLGFLCALGLRVIYRVWCCLRVWFV